MSTFVHVLSSSNRDNRWVAQIVVNGKNKFLGNHKTKEDAIKAREEAEIKYFGEFRYKGDNNEAS